MSDDDAPPLGRPIQAPRAPEPEPTPAPSDPAAAAAPEAAATPAPTSPATAAAPEAAPAPESSPESGRPGDATVGRPVQTPSALTPSAVTEAQVAAAPRREGAAVGEDLVIQPLNAPAFLTGGATAMLLMGACALLGLFAYAQGLSVLDSVTRLPTILQVPAYGVLGLFLLVILYTGLRLALIVRRLRVNRQISMTRVRALSAQPGSAERAYDTVKEVLSAYLRYYEPASASVRENLAALGMQEAALQRLATARDTLLTSRPISSAAWVAEFEDRILHPLDELARARILVYAKLVAAKTAISPSGLLDTAAVLFNNFRLLGDLCRIYQLRANWTGTLYLLFLMIFHSYVAGEVGEKLENMVGENLEGALEGIPVIQATLGSKVAGKVSVKVAEATANFLFTRRIGGRALTALRPLAS